MIRKKIVAVAAAALAACSICATAFATTNNVPKYPFGPTTLYQGGPIKTTDYAKKEDELDAWVDVERGLASGEAFVTFQFLKSNGAIATPEVQLWTNGEHYIKYNPGQGEINKYYCLRFFMEPQKVDSVYVGGRWAP